MATHRTVIEPSERRTAEAVAIRCRRHRSLTFHELGGLLGVGTEKLRKRANTKLTRRHVERLYLA